MDNQEILNKSELVAIRSMHAGDKNFLLATWLRSLFYGDSVFSAMKKNTFMLKYKQVIDMIINNPKTSVLVACLKEEPEVILGYSVLCPELKSVHWVYIKRSWRNIGLARDLTPADTTSVTHLTKVGAIITNKKNLEFDPFII